MTFSLPKLLFIPLIGITAGFVLVFEPLLIALLLLLCVSLFFFYHLINRPIIGVYMLVFFIPLQDYNFKLSFITLSIVNVLILSLILTLVIRLLLGYKVIGKLKSLHPFCLVMIILFLFSQGMSLLTAEDFSKTLRHIVTIIGGVSLFFLPALIVQSLDEIKKIIFYISLSIVVVSTMTIISGFFPDLLPFDLGQARTKFARPIGGFYLPFVRNTGLIKTQGSYGIWVLMGLPIVLMSLYYSEIRRFIFRYKLLSVTASGIILLGILISQSRNVWLGTMVCIYALLLYYFVTFSQTKSKVLILCLNLVLLTICFPVIYSIVEYYVSVSSENVYSRLRQFDIAFDIFSKAPLFGIGKGAFESASVHNLHNTYLFVLVTSGLFGFVPFVSLQLYSFKLLMMLVKREERKDLKLFAISMFASMVAMILQSMFFPGFSDKGMWVLLGFVNCLWAQLYSDGKSNLKYISEKSGP